MLIPTIRSIWDFKGGKQITCIMGFFSANHECEKNQPHHPTVSLLTLPGAFLGGCLPASGQIREDDDPVTLGRRRRFGIPSAVWAPTTLRRILQFQFVNWKRNLPLLPLPPFLSRRNSTLLATNFWERRGAGREEAAALCL